MDYRNTARSLCNSAKCLISSEEDDNLLFAALKLRMALESITYDRSKKYSDELGPEVMKTWQPKKLMERMLEVNPHVDQDTTLSCGEEPYPGGTPEVMRMLGTDRVLNLKTLKKHYDALGSYLHTPTIHQLEAGKEHDYKKLRKRCNEIVSALEDALSSPVWNARFSLQGNYECAECGNKIKRSLPTEMQKRIVYCWNCSASYTMARVDAKKVTFEPRQHQIECPIEDCDEISLIWEKDLKLNEHWQCNGCHSELTIALGVSTAKTSETPK
ncbi:hypothetical protein [Halocynthiibacter styelae]|uniref:Uncharacterized protein n=1 Tax=Halocynthiibacter styelae TaxID=2761955 RepID=A0A8J7LKU4_9RHOB|nr:hypothetical protein [Paenihalocynthiibacter styelae]MBI1493329.1 hypothetical protein [Paenihalocynthiibacter styelae]